jgi:hypothetical protein
VFAARAVATRSPDPTRCAQRTFVSKISITVLRKGLVLAETGPTVSHDVVVAFFAELRELAARDRFAIIIDTAPLGVGRVHLAGVGAASLAGMSQLTSTTAANGIIGAALVINAFEVRAMTSVVLAAVRPPWPTRVVKTRADALAYTHLWLDIEHTDLKAAPAGTM